MARTVEELKAYREHVKEEIVLNLPPRVKGKVSVYVRNIRDGQTEVRIRGKINKGYPGEGAENSA